MPHLYLAHWEWFERNDQFAWRSPNGGATGCLDLRNLPQMAKAGGTPEGAGLFLYDTPQSSPLNLADLGTDIERNLTASEKRKLKRAVGVSNATPIENTPLSVIRQMFLDPAYYDPTGQSRHKPLIMDSRRRAKMILGGRLFTEPRGSLLQDSTLAVFQADYIRKRARVNEVTGAEATRRLNVLRRFTGDKMRKIFGRMDDSLASQTLPDPYKGDGWLRPETTITESFNQADSSTLGPDLSWTETLGNLETVSNRLRGSLSGLHQVARADSDLSSDDHYGEVNVVTHPTPGTLGTSASAAARFNSSANSFYFGWVEKTDVPTCTTIINKVTAGSFSELAGAASVTCPTPPYTSATEANGSTIRLLVNDAEERSATDTSFTGQVRCGVTLNNKANAAPVESDSFEAADLTSPGPPPYHPISPFRRNLTR